MGERTPKATDSSGLLLGGFGAGARIGDYIIDQQLPSRGTGHVYSASHLMLPRLAMIRVLPAAVDGAREIVLELLREACILDAVDHPGVPRLFETGVLPDRRHWIATEHVQGTTLGDALDARAVEDHAVMTIIRDVADVLTACHAQELIHANVVPSVIVVPKRKRRHPLCLVDWAAARTLDSTRPIPLTPPQGSIGYLAPEQLAGKDIDCKADIYALGMIAREMGVDSQSELPPLFVALIDRMVAVDPANRPAASEVLETMRWLCGMHTDVPSLVARA